MWLQPVTARLAVVALSARLPNFPTMRARLALPQERKSQERTASFSFLPPVFYRKNSSAFSCVTSLVPVSIRLATGSPLATRMAASTACLPIS